jgi:hypothetical protein
VNQYRGRIQAELEKRLDRKVTLGEMHLSLFPPRFQVQSLSIVDDPKFDDAKPFLQAQEFHAATMPFGAPLQPRLYRIPNVPDHQLSHSLPLLNSCYHDVKRSTAGE